MITRKEAKRLREDALLKGLKTYSTGEPCKKGHLSEKYTSTRGCVQCALDAAKRRAESKSAEISAYVKQWNLQNKERAYLNKKLWKEANRDIHNASNAEWRKRNTSWCTAYVMKSRAEKAKRTPAWLTDDDFWMISEMYHLAEIRTKITGIVWHVDHVIPLRGKTVSGFHVPSNLRVITAQENMKKGNRYAAC